MKDEIFWLLLTTTMTSFMWLPYILNGLYLHGIFESVKYKQNPPLYSAWAERAKLAHRNAIENLVLFSVAIMSYLYLSGGGAESINSDCRLFFFARLLHYPAYILNIPFARSIFFAASMFALWSILYESLKLII